MRGAESGGCRFSLCLFSGYQGMLDEWLSVHDGDLNGSPGVDDSLSASRAL